MAATRRNTASTLLVCRHFATSKTSPAGYTFFEVTRSIDVCFLPPKEPRLFFKHCAFGGKKNMAMPLRSTLKTYP